MTPKGSQFVFFFAFLTFLVAFPSPLRAQVAGAALSGSVTNAAGTAVPGATVMVRNATTGAAVQTQTDSAGKYVVTNLSAGDYDVTVSAPGFAPRANSVTIAPPASQTLNVSLSALGGLSLSDLGFSPSETKSNPQEQARLDKRSHMLQMHQRLGLITTAPLIATVSTGAFAGGKKTSSTDRDLHAALGSATAGLYFATAYYAIFAPKIPGTKPEGNIRLHKAMAWIHGPGMVLTPVLGAMAFQQKSDGEKIHGIAQAHSEVAIVTAAAYGIAILSVSLKSGSASRSMHHVASVLHLGRGSSGDAAAQSGAAIEP